MKYIWLQSQGAQRVYRNRNGNWNADWNDFANSNSDGLMAWLAENYTYKKYLNKIKII